MTDFIFMWLEKLGYAHPLHPPVTHVPMGMVIGGCAFALIGVLLNQPAFRRTALHCFVFALIGIPPVMFAGYMDWQHFYGGEWQPYIILKIALATLLIAICGYTVALLRRPDPNPRILLAAAVLSLAVAGVIGFAGGEIQYGR